jgi:hypothetical protein
VEVNTKIWQPALVMLCLLVLATSVSAEEDRPPNKPWSKYGLRAGANMVLVNSNVRLGTQGGGLAIDPQDLLNLDTTTITFQLEGYWRTSDDLRHRLDFSWFAVNREGNTTLGRSIKLPNNTLLPLGTQVNTALDLDVIKASYSYSFFQDDRFDLAIAGGLYVLPIKFDLSASGIANANVTESITAPLPVFGIRADFILTPKWYLRNNLDMFYLEIGEYKGGIVDAKIAMEYKASEHVGVGLRGQAFNLIVESTKSTNVPGVDFNGAFNFSTFGLMLYLSVYL